MCKGRSFRVRGRQQWRRLTESKTESETEQSQFITAVAEMGISFSSDSLSKGNWADLPIEILDNELLAKVGDVEDSIRLGAVCSSWRSASLESKNTNNKSSVPWLMLAESEQEQQQQEGPNNKDLRKFFNLSTKKIIELYLPEAQGRRCLGSTSGWILTLGLDLNFHLLNPLTRLQISLPPLPTFKKQFRYTILGIEDINDEPAAHHLRRIFVDKFALSSHPNDGGSSSATVMVVGGPERSLSIARPGDTAWTHVECTRRAFDDVIFFNNLFYAVQRGGYVVVCDITTNPMPVATDFMPTSPFPIVPCINYYLVEMSGHLHMVVRKYKIARDDDTRRLSTLQFRVYKLNFPQKQWIELQNLGDYALFLGNNTSFAINHPHVRSNCIYFTDDHSENYKWDDTRDMGVFDFDEKKIIPGGNNIVEFTDSIDYIQSTFCTPLYFIPNLH